MIEVTGITNTDRGTPEEVSIHFTSGEAFLGSLIVHYYTDKESLDQDVFTGVRTSQVDVQKGENTVNLKPNQLGKDTWFDVGGHIKFELADVEMSFKIPHRRERN